MTRAFLLGLLTALVLCAAPARAASPEAIAAALAQRFGVKVLRVTPIEHDSKQLLTIVVMNPGGDFNEAFMVTTLIADAETGELVPQFRAENSGYQLPPAPDRQPPSDNGGTAIRRETFRGR